MPISVESTFDFYLRDIRIGGRIDRIDQYADGTIEIIDYKTGSNLPEEKDLKKNLQLTTYALAATMIKNNFFNKRPEQVKLSLCFIEENKTFTTIRTGEQLELAKEELWAKAKEIEASNFLCNRSLFCGNCEYKMLCRTKN